jgi:hypothetical protein
LGDEELSEGGVGVDVGVGSSAYWSWEGFPWASAAVAKIAAIRATVSVMMTSRRLNEERKTVCLMPPPSFSHTPLRSVCAHSNKHEQETHPPNE